MTTHRLGRIEVWAPDGMPEVTAGDDLTVLVLAALSGAGPDGDGLRDGDVVCVTSKVVSKAEGRTRSGDREDAIDEETVRVVARRGPTRIVRTRLGLTMAAAGVDASNVPVGSIVLLPLDPDASARALRREVLAAHRGQRRRRRHRHGRARVARGPDRHRRRRRRAARRRGLRRPHRPARQPARRHPARGGRRDRRRGRARPGQALRPAGRGRPGAQRPRAAARAGRAGRRVPRPARGRGHVRLGRPRGRRTRPGGGPARPPAVRRTGPAGGAPGRRVPRGGSGAAAVVDALADVRRPPERRRPGVAGERRPDGGHRRVLRPRLADRRLGSASDPTSCAPYHP